MSRPPETGQGFVRVGIDIGGTFTDLQILNERTATLHRLKVSTTPDDPSIGLMDGLNQAAAAFGFTLPDIRMLLHGTTIATNAVLERKLPRGVLLTTEGFEDVLEIGRHVRRDIYGARQRRPDLLIPRDRRFGVPERMRADGTAERPLDMPALDPLVGKIAGAEAIAVCLLHAYVNSAHEDRLAAWLAERLPHVPVSLSSDISPEIREYERSSTTALNALLMPVVGSYLARLQRRMDTAGLRARLLLVQSNGGVCSAEAAVRHPARLLLSGPSGGALATARMAGLMQRPNLLGVDMGGTSFDVCVVSGGQVTQMTQGEVDGLPVRLPMIEIRTIGSGGGSIASIDDAGRMRVGPRSAGSSPGPVCYGRGGTDPTVTDANLVTGRLDPERFLGGSMALDVGGARRAVQAKIAGPLGLDAPAAAEGILTVTNTNLAGAARLSLFEKGLDPRDFSLLSFGGAGGLHAIPLAEELGITEVVFPAQAATFSALGILQSNILHDLTRSRVLPATAESLAWINETLIELRDRADAMLGEDGVPPAERRHDVAVDLRYRGQASELVIPWPAPDASASALARLVAAFHAGHRKRFSYADPDAAVEIVALRLSATGVLPGLDAGSGPPGGTDAPGRRTIWLGGRWREVPVVSGASIAAGLAGPAIIEGELTTILLGDGWTCRPGPDGALVATRVTNGSAT